MVIHKLVAIRGPYWVLYHLTLCRPIECSVKIDRSSEKDVFEVITADHQFIQRTILTYTRGVHLIVALWFCKAHYKTPIFHSFQSVGVISLDGNSVSSHRIQPLNADK